MKRLLCLLVVALAGCDARPTAPAAKAGPLPPEVEHDPETAAKHYQKGKTPRR